MALALVRLSLLVLSFILAIDAGNRLYPLPLSTRIKNLQRNSEIFIPTLCQWHHLATRPPTITPQSTTRTYCRTTPESPLTVDIVKALARLNGYRVCCHANSRSLCTDLVAVGTGVIVLCGQRGQCLDCREATEAALDVVEKCRKDGRVEGVWEKEELFTLTQLIVGKVKRAQNYEVEEGKGDCKLRGGYTAWGGNICSGIDENEGERSLSPEL